MRIAQIDESCQFDGIDGKPLLFRLFQSLTLEVLRLVLKREY